MPPAKPTNEAAIQATLSAQRMSTYLTAASGNAGLALELYGWNARISAALMLPAHFAEVATRNAISEALASLYGPQWPWDRTYEVSLPSPSYGYNPRQDLVNTRRRHTTTGKVIAELKFVFWQKMFTARYQARLWGPHIISLFPNAPATATADSLRARIYSDLEAVRQLRNRMAHYEPIFTRDLADDLLKILDIIEMRSTDTAAWVRSLEKASLVLPDNPLV